MDWFKIIKEIEILDHFTSLLSNLYAGQEATVRTRHATMDFFKIWKTQNWPQLEKFIFHSNPKEG